MGRHRSYEHGHIFCHPNTGAHEVHGAIMDKYQSWKWTKSALGYPMSDEMNTRDGGRYNRFQKGLIVGVHAICEDGVNIDYLVDFEIIREPGQLRLSLFPKFALWANFRYAHNVRRNCTKDD